MKAANYIYSSISNKQIEYIGELDSAYLIIKIFDEIYLNESTALQIVKRNNLKSVELRDFTEMTSFLDEFEKAYNELAAAVYRMDEKEKLRYTLKGLPTSYSYIGDSIYLLT